MALTPEQIAQLKKDLIELNKLKEQLGEQKIAFNFDKAIKQDVEDIAKMLDKAKTSALDLETGFGGIAESIKNIVREWKTNFEDPTKRVTKSFTKLKSIAEDLSNDIQGITQLNKKQLETTTKQIRVEQEKLKKVIIDLKKKEKLSEVEKTILNNLQSEYNVTKDLLDQANSRLDREIQIQKTLGVTGKLFQGISGALQKIGVQSDEIENINKQMREAAESGSRWKTFTTGAGASLKAAFGTLKDPLVQLGLFVKGMKFLVNIGNQFSKSIYEISKNQAINYDYARLEAQRLLDASVASKDLLATQQNFVKATNELNDALGVANMYSSKQLEDYTNLTQKLGLTTDEASAYASFSAMSGRSAEDIVNSVAKQTKGNLSNKKVIQEVAKVSGQLYAQYKGNPENIAKAVVQTQKLGMSLQQAQNVARGLLNFEDSITNELEAELLTGKNLNLEKARYLALQGDSAGAAEEIARQVGGLSEFTKLNVIQQEALAKAAGMGVDEFTDTLRKKQEINKLDQSQAKLYQEEIKKAKEAGDIEKATALEKAMFGRKDFELSKVERDNAEKMQDNIAKMKNSFVSVIAPMMEKLTTVITKITELIATNPWISKVLAGAGALLGIVTAAAGIIGAVNVIRGVFGAGRVQKVFVVNQGPGGGGMDGGEDIGDLTSGKPGKKGGKTAWGGKPGKIPKGFKFPKKASKFSKLLKFGKGAAGGLASLAGGMALDYASSSQMEKSAELQQKAAMAKSEKEKKDLEAQASSASNIGKGLDVGSSALTGAGIGATIGSVIPGLGTVIGGAIGGALGAGYGLFQNFAKSDEDKRGEAAGLEPEPTVADDFISRPGQPPLRFRKDDIIVGGTNALGGGGNNNEAIALLRELISTVKAGGNVYLDSTKVGTALTVGTSRIQ